MRRRLCCAVACPALRVVMQAVVALLIPRLAAMDPDEPHMVEFESFLRLARLEHLAVVCHSAWGSFRIFRAAVVNFRSQALAPLRFYNVPMKQLEHAVCLEQLYNV